MIPSVRCLEYKMTDEQFLVIYNEEMARATWRPIYLETAFLKAMRRAYDIGREQEAANLRQQIEDAEIALKNWDDARDSEYWLRHHPDQ